MSNQLVHNEEFKNQTENLHKNGKSALEISREYNISKTSVYA